MADGIDKRELAVVLLVISSIFVALISLLPVFLTNDDTAYYANSIIDLKPGWMDGKPIYIWIGHLVFWFASLLGVSRPSLVFVFGAYSAFFGSLTGVNLYFIYRSIFNERYIGLTPALLTVFAPIGLTTSLLIAPYAVTVFFTTLAIAAWSNKRYLMWSLAWSMAICCHASSLLLGIAWLGSLLASRDKNVAKKIAKHVPIIFFVCIVCFGWVLTFYPSLDYFLRFNAYVTQKDYLEPITEQWFTGRLQALAQSSGLMLLILSAVGTYFLDKRRSSDETILLWWLAPYLLFYLFWPQAGGKFYIFCLPSLSMLASLGVRRLSSILRTVTGLGSTHLRFARPTSGFANILLILLIVMGGLTQGYGAVVELRMGPNEYSSAALAINQWVTEEGISSGILIISGWETHFIRFYSPGIKVVGWYGTLFPDTETQIASLVLNTITRAQANHERVFVTRLWYFQEASSDVRIALAASTVVRHFEIVETNEWLLEVV